MKKILILANNDVGLYNFRKELLEVLMGQGYEVYISLPVGEKVEQLRQMGCIFIETPVDRRGTNPLTDFKLVLKYLKIMKNVKPDVVLTYTIKPNIYGSIACRLLKIPYINNITGLGSGFIDKRLLSKLLVMMYKAAIKKSNLVFFQNSSDMDFMLNLGIISGKHKLLPGSGVNLDQFEYTPFPPGDKVVFNFIGRVMKEKGIDEYLMAAKTIKQRYPHTQFNIIGFIEPTEAHYNELIADYEAKNYIEYHGFQKDIRPFIKNSHCLIQPSYHEGMSNVLLESAAIGRALIASDIPGCREVIDNNGYVFAMGNVHDLVDKIERFIQLPYEQKVQMGKMSRQKVEREFDRQIVIDSYMKEINHICG
ncbi:MAG: glycosyltransferase family 4 protein [Syntrophomonadaceae bacterium]|nr:glycosyltransferase family 4 protein [Syntrophomonadaceae bacterium]